MREHFHNLQALCGVACLLVVFCHLAESEAGYGLRFNPLKPARWYGFAGVDLFFVLSGFIIASTSRPDLGRPARLPRYLFRRAWRIYPAYWAALGVAAAVLGFLVGAPLVTPGWADELRDTLLLLPQRPVPRLLGVAWTLSYELMFYLAFAALFLLPRRAAVPVLIGWAGVVVAVLAAGYRPANRFAALPVSPFVLEFLVGAAVAWCPARLTGRQAAGVGLAAAAWLGVWLAALYDPDPHWLPTAETWRVAVFAVAAGLVVFALAGWERAGGRLGWRWLERVGDASYSVYLLHVPLLVATLYLTFAVGWPHGKAGHLGWVAVMLAGGLLPGLLFHRWVERPLLNLAKRRKPDPVPAAVQPELPAPIRRAA